MAILGDMRVSRRPTIQIVLEDDAQREALLKKAEELGYPSLSAMGRHRLGLPPMVETRGSKKGRPRRPRRKRMTQLPLATGIVDAAAVDAAADDDAKKSA